MIFINNFLNLQYIFLIIYLFSFVICDGDFQFLGLRMSERKTKRLSGAQYKRKREEKQNEAKKMFGSLTKFLVKSPEPESSCSSQLNPIDDLFCDKNENELSVENEKANDNTKQQSTCLNPNSQQGTCISIKECPQLLQILRKPKPLATSDVNLLRESQCGFDEQNPRVPKVCCILENNNAGNGNTPPDVTQHRRVGRVNGRNCGTIDYNRIFGGNKTNLYEFPWMALIAYQTNGRLSFRCGGTLINDRYILTAAHCITNLPPGRVLAGVRLGEHNIGTDVDCQKIDRNKEECAPPVQDFTIEEIIPHPQYSSTRFSNDIGLLKLGATPDFTKKNIGTICLPVGSLQGFEDDAGIVAGWGATESGQSSLDLLKVQLPIVPNSECENIYSRLTTITHRQMCAGGVNGRDSCGGDSGGPFMFAGFVHNTAAYVQHGIVSFGPRFCATEGRPGVYTRIVHYLDWILDNIN